MHTKRNEIGHNNLFTIINLQNESVKSHLSIEYECSISNVKRKRKNNNTHRRTIRSNENRLRECLFTAFNDKQKKIVR